MVEVVVMVEHVLPKRHRHSRARDYTDPAIIENARRAGMANRDKREDPHQYFSELGRKGGLAAAEKTTPEERSAHGKKGQQVVRERYGPEHYDKMRAAKAQKRVERIASGIVTDVTRRRQKKGMKSAKQSERERLWHDVTSSPSDYSESP